MTNMEQTTEAGTPVPGFSAELGTRIAQLYERVGGQMAASRIVGITDEQLGKWKSGKAKMPFWAAAMLCERAGASLDWLARGEAYEAAPARQGTLQEPGPEPFEEDLMRDCIMAVEAVLDELGKKLTPEKRAEMIVLVYQIEIAARAEGRPGITGARIVQMVKAS